MTPLRLQRYRNKSRHALPRCTQRSYARQRCPPRPAAPAQPSCGALLFQAEALRQQMVVAVRQQLRSTTAAAHPLPPPETVLLREASVN